MLRRPVTEPEDSLRWTVQDDYWPSLQSFWHDSQWSKVLGRTSWWLPWGYVLKLRSPSERSFKWTPKLIPTQSYAPRGSAAYTLRETHLTALQPILQTTESILPLEASNRCRTFIGEGSLSIAGEPETRKLSVIPRRHPKFAGVLIPIKPQISWAHDAVLPLPTSCPAGFHKPRVISISSCSSMWHLLFLLLSPPNIHRHVCKPTHSRAHPLPGKELSYKWCKDPLCGEKKVKQWNAPTGTLSRVPAWPADLLHLRDARLQVPAYSTHGSCRGLSLTHLSLLPQSQAQREGPY